MRKWGILVGIVLLALVGALVLAALNLNRFLNQNRDLIAKQAQRAVGREVRFGELGVSFAGGLAVRVEDLRVGDDPAFSKEDFVSAETVDVGVKILPALFGRIELGRVVLRSPSISVIQTSQGLSIDSLGGAKQEPAPQQGPPPALLVSLVDIRDGTLRFLDQTAKPPAELRVTRLDFSASEVSLSDPVRFELSAALLGAEKQNLSASGRVGPLQSDSPQADLTLRVDPLVVDEALRLRQVAEAIPAELSASGPVRLEVEASGTLAKLGFEAKLDARGAAVRYGESFEKARGVPLDLSLRGEKTGNDIALETLEARVDETRLGGRATLKNLDDPVVDFAVTSEAIHLASFGAGDPDDAVRDVELQGDLALPRAGPKAKATLRSAKGTVSGAPYQNLALDLGLANQRVDISKLSLDAFEGSLSATGFYYTKNAQRPSFDLRTQLADMRVEKILESQAPAAARLITGKLGAKLDLRGAGAAWEQIKRSLTGEGDLRVAEGVIRDFNPAGPTLRAIMALPSLSSTALWQFLEDHPQVFGAEDTPFEIMEGRLQIRDGWVEARDFVLTARDYSLSGNGRYSLDNALDFKTVMTLSQKLSEGLVAAEQRLRYLRTPQGRVALPVAVRGAPPKLSILPDVTAVAQGASREALTDVLGKALGGKKAQRDPEAPPSQPEPPPSSQAATPSEGPPPPPSEEIEAPASRPSPPSGAEAEVTSTDPPPPASEEGEVPSSEPLPAPPSAEEAGVELLQRGLGELLGGEAQEPSQPAQEQPQQ
jgi:AsmA protein